MKAMIKSKIEMVKMRKENHSNRAIECLQELQHNRGKNQCTWKYINVNHKSLNAKCKTNGE